MDVCAICYEETGRDGPNVWQCATCHNAIHQACADQWFANMIARNRVPTCPLCRSSIAELVHENPRNRTRDEFDEMFGFDDSDDDDESEVLVEHVIRFEDPETMWHFLGAFYSMDVVNTVINEIGWGIDI